MPRRRLGVVLPVPGPLAHEVDGLRRACGDGMLGRVVPHLTLVPPVNVREADLGTALAVVRSAAADLGRPLTLGLGPVRSFLPGSPTVYLAVDGAPADLAALHSLRAAVFRGPLARATSWPFVPHVTVADEVESERIPAVLAALAGYRAEVTFDRLHVLEEGPGRVWSPIASAWCSPRMVVGRGGLALELVVSEVLDPEAAALLAEGAAAGERRRPADAVALVVTARLDGAAVGVWRGWTAGGRGETEDVVAGSAGAGLAVEHHLRAAARSAAADRGCVLA